MPMPRVHGPICTVAACEKAHFAGGLCKAHYTRKLRHGDPLAGASPVGLPLDQRLGRYTEREPDGCWRWTGTRDRQGYPFLNVGGAPRRAHRLMYEQLVGPIPSGLELDHLCRVRDCVNPSHLEAVTHTENMRRMRAAEQVAA